MTRFLLAAALIVVLTACGGVSADDGGSASAFALMTLEQARDGQIAQRLRSLHPAHQALIDGPMFINCRQDYAAPVRNVHAVDEHSETVAIPGWGELDTTAVTIAYEIGDREDRFVMHVLQVNGRWTWLLQPDDLAAYELDKCP